MKPPRVQDDLTHSCSYGDISAFSQIRGKDVSRFQEFDVLRRLAALSVLFLHYFSHWDRYDEDVCVKVVFFFGFYAMRLFFTISGFVIFISLDKCKAVTDCVVSRFSRL